MKFKEISDAIYSNTEDRERMEEMNELYYCMAEYISKSNPDLYKQYCDRAEDILYEISEDEAITIVRGMQPYGEHWSIDDIYSFVESKGQEPSIEYYLAMNMAFNDYRNTGQLLNADNADFYFSIAYDFINDPDGKRHKVEKYFRED